MPCASFSFPRALANIASRSISVRISFSTALNCGPMLEEVEGSILSKASQSASFLEMMKKRVARCRLYLLLLCCCRRCCCCCGTPLGFLTPARVSSQAKVHRLSRWSRACVVLALQPTAALPTDQLPHRRNFPYRGPSQSRLGRWIPST